MTKYFKANVELRQHVEVEVAAETKDEAMRKAKEDAIRLVPGADAWTVELTSIGETSFDIGVRIVHALWGPGEIISLIRTTGPDNDLGFRATVQLNNGDKKDLHMPHTSIKPEAFGAQQSSQAEPALRGG
ncbi:hypothetical protein [Luteimonas saliphila]|uniref:hypothetical protein n=1 Tax=Luteimonas saliphila TaxID=2804919 RepID=UPI00192E0F88|nr:hypothetical protein [Luteimonas saliphila]